MKYVMQLKFNTKWTKIKHKYNIYNEYKDVKLHFNGLYTRTFNMKNYIKIIHIFRMI
jgi:hypothetical protein